MNLGWPAAPPRRGQGEPQHSPNFRHLGLGNVISPVIRARRHFGEGFAVVGRSADKVGGIDLLFARSGMLSSRQPVRRRKSLRNSMPQPTPISNPKPHPTPSKPSESKPPAARRIN